MFHERAALVGECLPRRRLGGGGLPSGPIVFAGNVIFNAERCRYVNGCAEPIPSRTTARHALRTNDTLLHRITCSVGNRSALSRASPYQKS